MKILRVRPVGVRDGRRYFRVKIEHQGQRHRLLLSDEHLGSSWAFAKACRERLGKDVLSPGISTGELHAHLAHALVPASAGAGRPAFAAGERDRYGLPVNTPIDPAPAVRQLVSSLFGQLRDMMQSGSGDPDELEEVLTTALEQLAKLDD